MLHKVTPEDLLHEAAVVAHERLKVRRLAYYTHCGPFSRAPMSPADAQDECEQAIQTAICLYWMAKRRDALEPQ